MTVLLTRSYGRCVGLFLLVAWAAGCDAPAPASGESARPPVSVDVPEGGRTYPDGTPRIVVLGDSLTAGLGVAPGAAYPARLQEKTGDGGL